MIERAASNMWRTSVDFLLRTFQQSMAAVVPSMERARIGWKDLEAYDDWDAIASVLFKGIVLNSLSGVLAGGEQVASYGMRYENYQHRTYFIITTAHQPNDAFVSFRTRSTPFDLIELAVVDSDLVTRDHYCVPANLGVFAVRVRVGTESRTVEAIDVDV
jgi:hypothetical protein